MIKFFGSLRQTILFLLMLGVFIGIFTFIIVYKPSVKPTLSSDSTQVVSDSCSSSDSMYSLTLDTIATDSLDFDTLQCDSTLDMTKDTIDLFK